MSVRPCLAVAAVLATAPLTHAQVFGSEVGSDRIGIIDVPSLTNTDVGQYTSFDAFNLNGLAANTNTGQLYGLDAGSGAIFSVDPDTAQAVAITGNVFVGNANGLAYDANRNRLWVANNNGLVSFLDLTSGQTGTVGTAQINNLEGLAFDAATDTLFALSDTDDRIYTLDVVTLAPTALSDSLGSGNWRGLTYDANTNRLIASRVGGTTFLAEFDIATATVLQSGDVANVGPFVQGLAFIPSPGAMGVFAISGAAMFRRQRRRA